MTTLTAPAPQAHAASNNGEKPINLFQLGCLFVIRASQKVLPLLDVGWHARPFGVATGSLSGGCGPARPATCYIRSR